MAVPILRFSEFSDEWEQRSIGDVYSFKNGLNKEKEFFGRGTPILNYMDVNKNRHIFCVDILGKVMLTQKEISNFGIRKGDLFFTRTSETSEEIGLAGVLMEDVFGGVFSGFLLRARPKTYSIDAAFSGYRFVTSEIRKEIVRHSSITTRALTNGALLSKVLFRMPGVKEQKKIASLLGLLDWRIKLQRRKVELLKDMNRALITNLFTTPAEGSAIPVLRFKCSDTQWAIKKLCDIADITKGGSLCKDDLSECGTPCILYGELYTTYGPVADNVVSRTNVIGGLFLSQANDVILPSSGETAWDIATATCLINEGVAIGGDIIVIRSSIDGRFLSYCINGVARKYIARLAQGASVFHIYPYLLKSVNLSVPSSEEQSAIADTLVLLNNLISLNEEMIDYLNSIKKGLMSQMFI